MQNEWLTILALALLPCAGCGSTTEEAESPDYQMRSAEPMTGMDGAHHPETPPVDDEREVEASDDDLHVDSIDDCPERPETDNGFRDADGCPDKRTSE